MSRQLHPLFILTLTCYWLASSGANARAGDLVLGPADVLAADQPQVDIALEDPANPGVVVGPSGTTSAFLDTGSNGMLLSSDAFSNGEVYKYEQRSNHSVVQYSESGVAGSQLLNLTIPYNFYFQGSDSVLHSVPKVRLEASDPVNPIDLGGVAGIAGMPAMAGRVVNMDFRPLAQPNLMQTTFASAPPSPTANTYHVALHILAPSFPGQQQPTDPLPTYSGVPLVDNVTETFTDQQNVVHTAARTFLLDTGAQTSIISAALATSLGINFDPNSPTTDVVDQLDVGGIGGTVTMPLVDLTNLKIPTKEGTNLVLTDVEVGVLNLPGIDGVLGMNLLTSGYLDSILNGSNQLGYFTGASLDFTAADQGTLALDVNPGLVPEPSTLTLVGFGIALSLTARKSRRWIAAA